jgi:hypothetical protein
MLTSEAQNNEPQDYHKTPLTREEAKAVNDILTEKKNYVVVDKYNIEMSTEHINCLKNGMWLNDEVMNFYMCLLQVLHGYCNRICPSVSSRTCTVTATPTRPRNLYVPYRTNIFRALWCTVCLVCLYAWYACMLCFFTPCLHTSILTYSFLDHTITAFTHSMTQVKSRHLAQSSQSSFVPYRMPSIPCTIYIQSVLLFLC